MLDGRPIGVIRRVAGAGDFRCNMATGAVAVADSITGRDEAICARLAPLLHEQGLPFVGIDVIGGLLTEVNVTSPTRGPGDRCSHWIHIATDVLTGVEASWPASARAL